MRNIGKAIAPGYFLCPSLQIGIDQVHGAMADPAAQMMMMLVFWAHPVPGALTFVPQYINLPSGDQLLETPVNGCEPRRNTGLGHC